GVSPRLVPGFSKALVVTDSDEHTPDGHLTEDHGIRVAMQKKRMAKERGLHRASILPQWDGEDDPHLLFLSWGSSSGACREAAHLLQERKTSVATLHFSQLWPVNGEVVRRQMQKAMHRVVVESNSTGQFARLLFEQTGICADRTLLRFDGLPISGGWIVEELLKEELV
ncbi:MAG: 2-oxoacid:acceptor oxidoreductase subunit alpha, partial [Desulfobacterales bacterium]|nr:2-oxoacid:acceptor oxidoreductase subunit alpha [Desulfobacterales bacterium]